MSREALTRGSAMVLHSLSKYKPQRSRSRPTCSEYTPQPLCIPAPCYQHRVEYIPQPKNTPAQCANVEQVQRRFYYDNAKLGRNFLPFRFYGRSTAPARRSTVRSGRIEKQLVEKYSIPFEERNDLEVAHGNEILKTHCLGFTQGFKWAVYLLTGFKTDKEETADVR